MPEDTTPPAAAAAPAETEQVQTAITVVTEKTDNGNGVVPPEEDPQPTLQKVRVKTIVLSLTITTFVLSLPIMFTIIFLLYIRQYDCEDLIGLPKLQLAIALTLVAVFCVSNLAVYLRSRFPIPGLLTVMIPLIIMLVVGLGLVGAYKMESRKIPGSPPWLKSRIHSESEWPDIKSCIYETRTCKDLISRSYLIKSYDFISSKLSFIEAGCCTPPSDCEMEYVNATFWRKASNLTEEGAATDQYISDCNLWQNKESMLCYNCHACKDGYLRSIEGKWVHLGAFLIAISLLLTASHLLLFVATMWEHYGG